MDGIYNADDDGDDTGAFFVHHLVCAAAFVQHHDGITNPGLGVIQRDEIRAAALAFKFEWLDNQQSPVLIVCVADGGYYGADNFSEDHYLGVLIPAFLDFGVKGFVAQC